MIIMTTNSAAGSGFETAPASANSLIGVALDKKYRITELIGAGGTSCLYKGFDRFTDTPVVVKVLHRHLVASKKIRQRFEKEAKTASLLSYPNIVGIIDKNVMPSGQPYFVMECAKG